jgi:hypothetical protein
LLCDVEKLEQRIYEYENATCEFETTSILEAVSRAQRNRLEKIEHEMMAKLLNKSGDKQGLLGQIQDLHVTINELKEQTNANQLSEDNRKIALLVLSHLIGSMQASLQTDPPEELLPPISEVDMTIFQ